MAASLRVARTLSQVSTPMFRVRVLIDDVIVHGQEYHLLEFLPIFTWDTPSLWPYAR